MLYLWLKTLHIVFVTSWFAGLFYLPRIYVNMAQTSNPDAYQAMLGMAARLLRFTNKLAIPAVIFGLWMMIQFKIGLTDGWMHAKLLLVAGVLGYHYTCTRIYRQFEQNKNTRSHVYYRWFNEIPVFLLLFIVALVIIKPF
ncbi:CopD family protein [Advenella sp. WQ 585]|uniref:Protoporphyrinogen IX oxidase n=1 Tax=Advenella mandrilli TaxID=2800330 RepID=A0ABS1EEB3_9BURK|nr:CopD family protein [Advenella mandrilli]MBK1779845.1 CopD family protein [Advenella mandrilli]